jgi:hypothetical protein
MALYDVLEWDGALCSLADSLQGAFRHRHVLEIVQVLEDGFTSVIGFRAAGASGQLLKTLLDGSWKPNG